MRGPHFQSWGGEAWGRRYIASVSSTTVPVAQVRRTLRTLRRRAGAIHGLRALWLGLGAAGAIFLAASLVVGPVIPAAGAIALWSVVGATFLGGLAWGLRPLFRLRGDRITRLLARHDARLASMVRSAIELASAPSGAPDLVAAHVAEVEQTLTSLPAREVVPLRDLRAPLPLAGLITALLVMSTMLVSDRAAAGAFALLHPGARDDGGAQLARVATEVQASVRFPAYMGRAPVTLTGAHIELPKGATVVWSMRPTLDVLEATLEVPGGERVRLSRRGDRLTGRFVVRESGALTLTVRDAEGRRLRDATHRTVRILEDTAPTVALSQPATDATVEVAEPVLFAFEAQDDIGLRQVELVVETATGQTIRRALVTLDGEPTYGGTTRLSPVEVGAQPGDELRVRVEATDGDDISGPNIGQSEVRRLIVASDATRRAQSIARLGEVLDAALAALADRLEQPVAEPEDAARARLERVTASTLRYTERLEALAEQPGSLDGSLLREIARRTRRGLTAEERAYVPRLARMARRADLDRGLVTQLEDDSLRFADLLGRARLDDAAAIARELERLRREMTSLLAELRRTESAEARLALMAALRRAQARMRDLGSRLEAITEDVPQEFLNTDALPTDGSESALQSFAQALEEGNLEAAERHLMDFEREIDRMAAALGSAGEALAEARFGPRERAMAEAMDALAGLETEQRQLAQRSEATRREVARRALEAADGEAQNVGRELAERTRRARERLATVPPGTLGPTDQESFERAHQRLADAELAFRNGDLGEARRMLEVAGSDTTQLRRELELSALMFPGRDGRVADAARLLRESAEEVADLSDALDEAIPRLADFVERRQREQLRADAPRQRAAAEAAQRLAERFESQPDGAPLSPDGAREVTESRRAMKEAMRALQRGEPVTAARAQQEAAQRLSELRQRLEENQQQQQRSEGGGEGGSGNPVQRTRVEIPGAERSGSTPLRRRLLDAMRDGFPRGYEDSVRRYYEELLR